MIIYTIAIASVLSALSRVNAGINFLAIGDWGGDSDSSPATTAQKQVSSAMNTLASKIPVDFYLALGDNFYNSGVKNVDSKRFDQSFESVYNGPNLQKKWYIAPGNHDYSGNVSAQIAYSSKSTRWTFPKEYHSHSFTSSDGVTVDLIIIDTVHMSGQYNDEIKPIYKLPLLERSVATTQWDWLEQQLKTSTAQYLLVGGHYPVYSVCEHGNTATLVSLLNPLLQQYGAHYMSGHDHCMEHLVENKVNHFLTGMGKECCYSNSNLKSVPANTLKWYLASNNAPSGVTGGFTAFTATKTSLTATYYDQTGTVRYTAPAVLPR